MRARAGNSRRAFSLYEVVIVLLLVGMIATIALPRYTRSNERYRADAAARRVATDVTLARSVARTTGSTVSITFDAQQEVYEVSESSGVSAVILGDAPYRADIVGADFGADAAVLTFDGYGRPANTGTVIVAVSSNFMTVEVGVEGKTVVHAGDVTGGGQETSPGGEEDDD